jgi:hypothetical protein
VLSDDIDYEEFSLQNPNARKRLALNSNLSEGVMVEGATSAGVLRKVAEFEDWLETNKGREGELNDTPRKNANKKKARKYGEDIHAETINDGSAASFEEDRWTQSKY